MCTLKTVAKKLAKNSKKSRKVAKKIKRYIFTQLHRYTQNPVYWLFCLNPVAKTVCGNL